MQDETRKICLGAIAGAFGVHGEVRLKSFCAEPSDIAKYGALFDDQGARYTILKFRPIKAGFAAHIEEVPDRERAEALRSTRLYALRTQLPALEVDEYYHSDLIGMEVADGAGARLGKVKSVQNFGAGDLLEIHYGRKTALIPFTREIVPMLDMKARKIVIDPPEGLLD